jgi:hypothetical protein
LLRICSFAAKAPTAGGRSKEDDGVLQAARGVDQISLVGEDLPAIVLILGHADVFRRGARTCEPDLA